MGFSSVLVVSGDHDNSDTSLFAENNCWGNFHPWGVEHTNNSAEGEVDFKLTNFVELSRSMSVGSIGESAVAKHRHLRVSLPVPYSIALAMILSLIFSVMGTFSAPILT